MLVSRQEALNTGLPTYFTGKPCKHGHIESRYVTKGECLRCRRSRYTTKRDKYLSLNRVWKTKNPKLRLAHNANREAAKLKRTPRWANLEAIKQIYLDCPDGYHVDHQIPLRGSAVCGFHVEYNLQYLTAEANLRKGNSL